MPAGIEFDPAERDAIAAEVNLSVLKRSDPAINSVLRSANHVCLYQLQHNTHQWHRLDVEGSLFIVDRLLDHPNNPHHHTHRIVIINRKSLDNYTDDIIVGNKHLELTNQMIMYSNSKSATIGIWFYQKDQAQDIFQLLQTIVNADNHTANPQNTTGHAAAKRPGKKDKQKQPSSPHQTEQPSAASPALDNSLERFFPNLKHTNGVAGQQVPKSAQEAMLESHAVDAMSAAPSDQNPATAFSPSPEIDSAIVTSSASGAIEQTISASTPASMDSMASQVKQLVTGKPKTEQRRKSSARPRPNVKPTWPSAPSDTKKANEVSKSPTSPRQNAASKPNATQKAGAPAHQSINARTNVTPKSQQQQRRVKSTSPAKRASGGKRGQATTSDGTGNQQPPDGRNINMSTNGTAAGRVNDGSQIQILKKEKPDASSEPSENSKKAESIEKDNTEEQRALSTQAASHVSNASMPGGASSHAIDKSASLHTGKKELTANAHGGQAATSDAFSYVAKASGQTAGALPVNVEETQPTHAGMPPSEEDTRRQLENLTLQQAHTEKLKLQEARMRAMQAQFPYAPGSDMSIGQPPGMMVGGVPGGGGPSGAYPPSLHPQMAMMMQQQRHHLYMQQQYMAQQQHQRQMQMQGMAHGHVAVNDPRSAGAGPREVAMPNTAGNGQPKTKEESADELMRMLKVERPEGKKPPHGVVDDKEQTAMDVGASIAAAEKAGQVTGGDEGKLDRGSFRAVLQRMLTDRKLFDSVYGHYLSSAAK